MRTDNELLCYRHRNLSEKSVLVVEDNQLIWISIGLTLILLVLFPG